MDFTIRATDAADEGARAAILRSLLAYNAEQAGPSDARSLAVLIHDVRGDVVGGLCGRTGFGWLFIELLFVPKPLRGQGVGRDLMLRAESDAIARGCHSAWLDTFEFQARGFYERLGYRCFGQLHDYPKGFSRFFMTKSFNRDPGSA